MAIKPDMTDNNRERTKAFIILHLFISIMLNNIKEEAFMNM